MNTPKSLRYNTTLGVLVLLTCCLPLFAVLKAALQPGSISGLPSITAAGGSYLPAFSEDGKYVVFVSQAKNLVTNDDMAPSLDVFRWERASSNLVLVSVSMNGVGGGNDHSQTPSCSANGRFIVFASEASNLVPQDPNRASDIYLRDVANGTTTLVSANQDGSGSGNAASTHPLVSADGRFVFFESRASDLVLNDGNQATDVFVRDLQNGQTTLVSRNAGRSGSANGRSQLSSISQDGRYVAFVSQATDLVTGTTNKLEEVYVCDMQLGRAIWASVFRPPGPVGVVNYPCTDPILNREGTYLAYKAGTVGVVRYELAEGTNASAWRWAAEPANGDPLCISTNGRYLVFATANSALLTGNSNKVVRVDAETLTDNGQDAVEVVSATNNAVIGAPGVFSAARSSADGQRVLFVGTTTNLIAGTPPNIPSLYARDMGSGTITVLCTKLARLQECSFPDLSFDGSVAVFESPAELVPGDHNHNSDVFLQKVSAGVPVLISQRATDKPENTALAPSGFGPGALSSDGNQILFTAGDGNLALNDTNHSIDLFLLDVPNGKIWGGPIGLQCSMAQGTTNVALHTNSVQRAVLSADGRYAAYDRRQYSRTEIFQLATRRVYRLDRVTGLEQVVSATPSGIEVDGINPSISLDGRYVAYITADPVNLLTGSIFTDGNSTDVVLCDLGPSYVPGTGMAPVQPALTNIVLSVSLCEGRTANYDSRAPIISPDARWVVFSSRATDLTTNGPQNYSYEIYHLYTSDLKLGSNKMLDRDTHGVPYLGGASNAVFSANSEWAAFQTTADQKIFLHPLTNDFRITITNLQPDGPTPLWSTNLELLPNIEVCQECRSPALSQDGRYVAFESRPRGGPTNIAVRDMQAQTTEVISLDMAGTGSGNGPSHSPLISPDGRYVVFVSLADNLVTQDRNGMADVFIRDRSQGKTWLASLNMHGNGSGNGKSLDPVLSADGRTLAFRSFANDLVANDFNDAPDVFVLRIGSADTDNDGMDDDWEAAYFGNLASDGTADYDHDGAADLQEFRAGTDPTNGNSVFRVMTLSAPGPGAPTGITVLWTAVPGKTYRVQHKSDLAWENWTDMPGDVLAESAIAAKSWNSLLDSPTLRSFYRVVLVR